MTPLVAANSDPQQRKQINGNGLSISDILPKKSEKSIPPRSGVNLLFGKLRYCRRRKNLVIYRSVKFGKGQMTIEEIGQKVRESRRRQGLTQPSLAMVAGTGLRFIVDLEAGKPTCQVGKVLQVLTALGIQLSVSDPATA